MLYNIEKKVGKEASCQARLFCVGHLVRLASREQKARRRRRGKVTSVVATQTLNGALGTEYYVHAEN